MDEICEGCSILDINKAVPLDVAVPIYGFFMPILIAIMCVSNSFIILVLSQKHMRTPTNNVLLAMATCDLLTGITPLPWFIYYYSLRGYKSVERSGFNYAILCQYPYISNILPTIWHTSLIWLTVFLAAQRYVYVCAATSIHRFCTPRITKISILLISFCSISTGLPEILGKTIDQVQLGDHRTCVLRYTSLVLNFIGIETFYTLKYWSRLIFIHAVPCILLTIFTYKLARTIRKTEVRKRSWIHVHGDQQTFKDNSGNGTAGSSRRSLFATNRMLTAICILFLLIEIPAAAIFAAHFVIAKNVNFFNSQNAYYLLNIALIIRNFLIILASPIQFSIYCSMSEQFRLTARQLFSSKLLFVTQAQASLLGGRRYSLVLVDVDSLHQKRFSFRRKLSQNQSVEEGRKRSRSKIFSTSPTSS